MIKLFKDYGEWLVKIWIVFLGIFLFLFVGLQFDKLDEKFSIKPSEVNDLVTHKVEKNYIFNDISSNEKSDNIWKFTTAESLSAYEKASKSPLDELLGKDPKTKKILGINDEKLIREIEMHQLSETKYKVARINDDYAIITEFGDYKASKSDIDKALKQIVTDNDVKKGGK